MKKRRTSHIFRILGSLAGLALVAVSIWLIVDQLEHFNFLDVMMELRQLSWVRLLISAAFIVTDYVILVYYDLLGLRYVGIKLPLRKVIRASFVGHVFTINTTMFLGSSVRYRLYSRLGVTPHDVTNVVLFCTIIFLLGFLAMGAVFFPFVHFAELNVSFLPHVQLQWLGIFFALILIGYIALNGLRTKPLRFWKWHIPSIPAPLAAEQILVGFLDWFCAACAAYVLFPSHANIALGSFLEVFLLAQLLGQISQAPAGLGVFEATMILLLQPTVQSSVSVGPLLVYRVVYYLVPFLIGTIWFTVSELLHRRHGPHEPAKPVRLRSVRG